MPDLALATIADAGEDTAAVVLGDAVHPLARGLSLDDLLSDWDAQLAELDARIAAGELLPPRPVSETRFRAPVSRPANLYMAGANYEDHSREMRGLAPDEPVPRPPEGPFVFLKPTTTLIGSGEAVVISPGCEKVDWEIELAVVIGRRAHGVSVAEALAHVAGYTIVNDISVRDRFRRSEGAEPPMAFDWLAQKGWATSCPCGPWLVPARERPDAGDVALRLTRNGVVEQQSRTSQMIFTIAEQIAYISAIVPLVPGDMICTGTPAGVGAGKGRFLAPGDVVVAEIDGIGRLENPVVGG